MPIIDATEKVGVIQTGAASRWSGRTDGPSENRTTTSAAASTAAGTASSLCTRPAMNQVRITGRACQGILTAAWNGTMHSGSSTPPSIACASVVGIAAANRPSGCHIPASTVSAPANRNAPTAPENPAAGAAETASSAAPGVDQATLIGWRYHRLSTIAASPMARAAIISPDAACGPEAPMASSPCRTIGKELKKPTTATTSPVETVCIGGKGLDMGASVDWSRDC